ncbi:MULTISPECIES: hypothetical protein [Fischerella]|nr:hypothetical protein [Fischerella sp. FACHB-380]MBD2433184.1 hypothetical protein [Fischerella sp. FACHB-380]
MLIANKPTDPSEMHGAIATHSCEKVQLAIDLLNSVGSSSVTYSRR